VTNRQLLRTLPERLSSVDRQRQHVLAVASITVRDEGLPVPMKSSCWFCPASKKHEIVWLREHHPELLERALAIEENARPNLTSVVGLGRSFSWADFLDDLDDTPLFDCCE
jgi:hypothetical protein